MAAADVVAAEVAAKNTAPASIDMIEAAKKKAAYRAVDDFFSESMQFIGIGSGSTIIYGVQAIKEKLDKSTNKDGRYIFFVGLSRSLLFI